MAFCSNCGNEIPDGVKFCSVCGTSINCNNNVTDNVNYNGSQPQGSPVVTPVYVPYPVNEGKPKKKKKHVFLKIIIVLFVISFLGGIVENKNSKKGNKDSYDYSTYEGSSEKKQNIEKTDATGKEGTEAGVATAESSKSETSTDNSTATGNDTSVAQGTENSENNNKVDGVDPELKAFLDSYEAFMDEYVAFMKKYNSDTDNAISMLADYSKIMARYTEFATAIDKYDSDEMSVADAKYYLDVVNRCNQKMLDVY